MIIIGLLAPALPLSPAALHPVLGRRVGVLRGVDVPGRRRPYAAGADRMRSRAARSQFLAICQRAVLRRRRRRPIGMRPRITPGARPPAAAVRNLVPAGAAWRSGPERVFVPGHLVTAVVLLIAGVAHLLILARQPAARRRGRRGDAPDRRRLTNVWMMLAPSTTGRTACSRAPSSFSSRSIS